MLVVDDNADAADTLGELLRAWGYHVTVAHDGPAALAALQDTLPDIALLDIGMPAMDGYELAAHLRFPARMRRAAHRRDHRLGRSRGRAPLARQGLLGAPGQAGLAGEPADLAEIATGLARIPRSPRREEPRDLRLRAGGAGQRLVRGARHDPHDRRLGRRAHSAWLCACGMDASCSASSTSVVPAWAAASSAHANRCVSNGARARATGRVRRRRTRSRTATSARAALGASRARATARWPCRGCGRRARAGRPRAWVASSSWIAWASLLARRSDARPVDSPKPR